ncbi:hypothetical protein GH714_007639 [Hevea brasiliensis]|uniref:Uncharacterized protein n=1 Tax=Hevea brasiliensis TaxID=3981 RepID=A0A6A6M972_HEVBR|nr:hypothetical protein GH714_007639 [Hevea brasiliensis]
MVSDLREGSERSTEYTLIRKNKKHSDLDLQVLDIEKDTRCLGKFSSVSVHFEGLITVGVCRENENTEKGLKIQILPKLGEEKIQTLFKIAFWTGTLSKIARRAAQSRDASQRSVQQSGTPVRGAYRSWDAVLNSVQMWDAIIVSVQKLFTEILCSSTFMQPRRVPVASRQARMNRGRFSD